MKRQWLFRMAALGVLGVALGLGGMLPARAVIPDDLLREQSEYVAAAARRKPWLTAGDAHFYRLQPQRAISYYRAVLDVQADLPKDSIHRFLDNGGRAYAATGLARAYSMMGDFKSAAEWLERSFEYPANWCGVYFVSHRLASRAIIVAWQRAGQAPDAVERSLRRLVAREDKVLDDEPRPEYEHAAKDLAAYEARFLLAEFLFKQGRRREAERYFRQVTRSEHEFFPEQLPRLAQAYLRSLGLQ